MATPEPLTCPFCGLIHEAVMDWELGPSFSAPFLDNTRRGTIQDCFFLYQLLHEFPRAPVTRDHRGDGWKQEKFVLSQLWGLKVRNQDVSRATAPWRLLDRNLACLFLASAGDGHSLVLLGLQQCHSNLCLCHHRGVFSLGISDPSCDNTGHFELGAPWAPV